MLGKVIGMLDPVVRDGGAVRPGRLHPGVGVGAVVVRAGALLMVRRAGAHGAGLWAVPGGWVELFEDPFDAASREVLEETGVHVEPVGSPGWTDSPHPEEGVHALTLWIECRHVAFEPRVVEPAKCPEVAWVPFAEITDRPLFAPFAAWWPTQGVRLVVA
ncbi:MAG TPA: NUDIX domain-containing protein [Acidimicrobiales bacterium]|nr:NUDIX domain-containing protein [Acidimicrobiales bacterium]